MGEKRLVEIESKLAHHEHLLFELDDVVTRQQAQISELETRCRLLRERLRTIDAALPADSASSERPPHY